MPYLSSQDEIDCIGCLRELVRIPSLSGQEGRIAARIADEIMPGGVRPTVVVTGGASGLSWMRDALLLPAGPSLPAIADVVDPELLLRSLGRLSERYPAVTR